MNRREFFTHLAVWTGAAAAVGAPLLKKREHGRTHLSAETHAKRTRQQSAVSRDTRERVVSSAPETERYEPSGLEIETGHAISELGDEGRQALLQKLQPRIARGHLLARFKEEGVVPNDTLTEYDISAIVAYEFDRLRDGIGNATFKKRFGDTHDGKIKYFRRLHEHKHEIVRAVSRASQDYGVPVWVLYGVIGAESGGNPYADSGVAKGIMQFTQRTGAAFGLIKNGVDYRSDITLSVRACAAYLAKLFNEFGQWGFALAAYTGGASSIKTLIKKAFGRVPAKNLMYRDGISLTAVASPLFNTASGSYALKYPFIVDRMAVWVRERVEG